MHENIQIEIRESGKKTGFYIRVLIVPMTTAIFFYILLGLVALTNEQTTASSQASFMGYPIEYEDIDVYSCTTTTTMIIPDDTTTVCLTSTEVVSTTSTTTTTTSTTATTTTTSTTTATTTTSTSTATTTTSTTTTTITTTTSKTTTTITTTTTISTTAAATTIQTSVSNQSAANNSVFVPPLCANKKIGSSCNISSDSCTLSQPCLNLATCYLNINVPLGYTCTCVLGFEGLRCETDTRGCRPSSPCLYGGACNETSNDTSCACPAGKVGDHCEYQVDSCANIKCENNAVCQSLYSNWSCLCTNPALYSGTYCQIKSTSLLVKETISRSFAGVAIGCIAAVISFVLIMDILKYFFHVDPVENERHSVRKKNQNQQRRKLNPKPKQPPVVVRFQYIHA